MAAGQAEMTRTSSVRSPRKGKVKPPKTISSFTVVSHKDIPRHPPRSPTSPLSPVLHTPGSPKLPRMRERPQHPCNPVDTVERRNALTKRPYNALAHEAPEDPSPMSRAGLASRQNTYDIPRECSHKLLPPSASWAEEGPGPDAALPSKQFSAYSAVSTHTDTAAQLESKLPPAESPPSTPAHNTREHPAAQLPPLSPSQKGSPVPAAPEMLGKDRGSP
eukprot:Hpha_TRINITY_DN20733_c0_g1::TRINITY_DN20733_c0_g1_i1::g.33423::m.33423